MSSATSNRFIIEMLQAVKTYQTKIKNETWFSLFPNLAFVVIALSTSVPCNLETQFQNEFNRFNRRVLIIFEYLHDNIGDLVPLIHAVEFFVAEVWYHFKTFHCVPLCS